MEKLDEEDDEDEEGNGGSGNSGKGGGAATSAAVTAAESAGPATAHTAQSEAKIVARTFRYMRRKPTIISYKPPEGGKSCFQVPTFVLCKPYISLCQEHM